jgi:hypothetical protein
MAQSWRRSISGAAGLAAVLLAGPAAAASQGSLGGASHGSITITASIAAPARAAGLSDFALDSAGAASAQDICFKGAPHTYTVAATGSGPDGALSLSNGDRSIAYRVEWQPREGPAGALSDEAPITIEAVADPADCGSAQGAGQLTIALESADAAHLDAGAPYAGTLNLTLAPE